MKIDLKVGDRIICHTECIMSPSGSKATTVGKSYKIIKLRNRDFIIIDDQNEEHTFCIGKNLSDYRKWFSSIKDRKNKLEKIYEKSNLY